MRQLTHVDTREVSLVTRPANRRRFALLKADLTKREFDPNVGGGVDRDKIPAEDFAGANRSFPIVTPKDVSDAARSLGRTNQDRDKVKARIIAIARRKGPKFVAALPEAWKVQKGERVMPRALDLNDENIQAVLAEPVQGEDTLIEQYAPGASDEVKAAMAASLRLLVAASEETGPEAVARIAKAAFAKARDDGDDEDEEEEEERKRKEDEEEEEERKRKAVAMEDEEEERKRAAVAKIAKLEQELQYERNLRLQKEAEDEAARYGYIPMPTKRIATILRKADEAPVKIAKADGRGEESLGAAVREVLKAAHNAIEKAGVLGQRGSDLLGNPGGARERLNAMASERIAKAEGKETFEAAFAAVVRANPDLYAQYLREEHSGRR